MTFIYITKSPRKSGEQPFPHKSVEIFEKTIKSYGYSLNDFYFTHIENNEEQVAYEIENLNPSKIFITHDAYPFISDENKGTAIGNLYGQGLYYKGVYTVVGIHPSELTKARWDAAVGRYVIAGTELYRDYEFCLRKFFTNDRPFAYDIKTQLVQSIRDVTNFFKYFKYETISVDIETTGLDFMKDTIDLIGCGVSLKHGENYFTGGALIFPKEMVDNPKVMTMFRACLLKHKKLVFHNAKFDVKFLNKHLDMTLEGYDDTILKNYTVDERSYKDRSQPHGLKTLARVYFDEPDYHFSFKKFWETPDEEKDWATYQHYLAKDVCFTARLNEILDDEMTVTNKKLYSEILLPSLYALVDIETLGVVIDREYLKEQEERSNQEIDKLDKEIEILSSQLISSYDGDDQEVIDTFNKLKDTGFNPNSPKQIQMVIKSVTGLKMSSAKDVLEKLIEEDLLGEATELVEKILQARLFKKLLGTYIVPLLEQSEVDGKLRGDFNLIGTASGRLSSSKPNLQNIPVFDAEKSKTGVDIRKAFTVPEGFTWVTVDYSQLELKVVALLSNDKKMIQAFRDGRDIHAETASVVFGVPQDEVTVVQRKIAKAMNFGLVYGISSYGISNNPLFMAQGWDEDRAELLIERFFKGYKELDNWLKNIKKQGLKEHQITTPTNRIRRFPFITNGNKSRVERQIANTPVQGIASDYTQLSLIKIHEYLKNKRSKILLTVHDELDFMVANDEYDEIISFITDTMRNIEPIPSYGLIEVDVEKGKNWSEISK